MHPDVIVTWAGAAGVTACLVYIHRRRTRSFLESRMMLLLYGLAALLWVRGWFWLDGDPRLRTLTLVPAALLPLAATLFVEGLLRRHGPLALKLLVAIGSVVMVVTAVVSKPGSQLAFRSLQGYLVLTLLLLFWLLLRRDRGDLAAAENALVDAMTVATAVAIMVALTDFRLRPSWLDLRLGGIGGLLVVYASVAAGRRRPTVRSAVVGTAWTLAKAATVAAAVIVLWGDWSVSFAVPAFFVCLALVLLLAVVDKLRTMARDEETDSFRHWLLTADTRSLDTLVDSLERLKLAENHLVLRAADLRDYSVDGLVGNLAAGPPVRTLAELRREHASPEAAEQLVDLLESHGMSHLTLLSRQPPVLFLVALPDVAPAQDWLGDLAIVRKIAESLPAETANG
ncbi:MAG: hypothetical protein AAF481_04380 [Acidobacteriota bacterium]